MDTAEASAKYHASYGHTIGGEANSVGLLPFSREIVSG